MAKNKKYKEPRKTMIDSYTGEVKPVVENADKMTEVSPMDTAKRGGKEYLLEEETRLEVLAADEDSEAAAEQSASFTEDEQIKQEFLARQKLAVNGRKELEQELDEHHSLSPEISGGDLDADWQSASQGGEETVGGSNPTPDQDIVENLGKAAGLTYRDDEPLHGEEKLLERDRKRWELNPASVEDEERDETESRPEAEEEDQA